MSADSAEMRKYWQGKQGHLGETVTHIPIEFDNAGNPLKHANLVTQYQVIPFKRMQREAHARFANPVAEGDKLPDPPWSLTALDPANNVADRSRFYRRVDSGVIVESIKNSVTPSGFTKIISNKLPLISFRDPATGVETIDGP